MTAQTNTTVTPAQRFALHAQIADYRKNGQHDLAAVLDQCTYWESFPSSYSAEKVAAAVAVMTAGIGGDKWAKAITTAAILMDKKGK